MAWLTVGCVIYSGGYPHLTRFGHGNKNLKIPDRHNLFSFVRSL